MSGDDRVLRSESFRSSLSEFAFEMEMEEGGWLPSNAEIELFASDFDALSKGQSKSESPNSTGFLIYNWMRGCDYKRIERGSLQGCSSEESENFTAGCTPAY
eukprot:59078-Hanusia_phi.AAC.6